MRLSRLFALSAFALLVAVPAFAGGGKPVVVFDPSDFDASCAPCRDFDQFASGGWTRTHTIPPARSAWGSFEELGENNQQALYAILESAAKDKSAKPGTPAARLGDYYGACMDSAAAEAAGVKPIQPLLDAIAGMKSNADLPGQVAWLHAHGIRGALFQFGPTPDARNSDVMIAGTGQGGLGLPDRDYYLKTDSASVVMRRAYEGHIARMFQLLGIAEADAKRDAARVVAIETALAKASMNNVQRRDPNATYHKLPLDSLRAMAPAFDWNAYLSGRHGPAIDSLNIAQPAFVRALDGLITATPTADWQAYLRWKVVDDAAATLSSPFVDEDFAFARLQSGARVQQPRWRRCLRATDGDLGDVLGQVYVARHFPPAARDRVLRLVHNLESALADRLVTLDWMSDATKSAARIKLDAFAERIGYPDKWRTYEGAVVTRASYYANHVSARTSEVTRNFGKIGKPVDKSEWGMTPPTVNAFYSPTYNSINFPAGILQPPFYDPSWDDAANYGAIGAVIGHEMTHGFDDSGRQFDAAGNLRDWWTAEDAARYKERTDKVVQQFDDYTVLDTLHVNGRLTLGENIADLGGLALAYAALQKELAGKPHVKIDGYTPEQRFFLAYAQVWRGLTRDEALRTRVLTNPHSPAHWRVNGPLSNLDEFAKAFGCKEGDAMVRKQELRARIW